MPTQERSATTIVVYDVHGVKADARLVNALARLQLVARRRQCRVRLRGASKELRELVAFMGLSEVLPG
jgi:ABC-type transporter Mla MlaB component